MNFVSGKQTSSPGDRCLQGRDKRVRWPSISIVVKGWGAFGKDPEFRLDWTLGGDRTLPPPVLISLSEMVFRD